MFLLPDLSLLHTPHKHLLSPRILNPSPHFTLLHLQLIYPRFHLRHLHESLLLTLLGYHHLFSTLFRGLLAVWHVDLYQCRCGHSEAKALTGHRFHRVGSFIEGVGRLHDVWGGILRKGVLEKRLGGVGKREGRVR